MIFAGYLGQDTAAVAAAAAPSVTPAAAIPAAVAPAAAITPPLAPSRANRDPFQRPAAGRRGFVPSSLRTEFVPEFEPFPSIMHFPGASLPRGIRNPLRSEPGAEQPRADPSGQSSVPATVPSPVKMSSRMLPPNLVMALGIMPSVRGVRAARVDPTALVASGRFPTGVG